MLKLIFCLHHNMAFHATAAAEKVISELKGSMQIEKICAHPDDLSQYLKIADPNDYYLLFLSDGFDGADMIEVMLHFRACLMKAFIIYFSDDKNALTDLVNHNVMPSGFLSRDPEMKAFLDILSHVYARYRSLINAGAQQFTVVVGKRLYSFLYADIMSFEAKDKKIYLTTTNNRFTFYDSLISIETRLGPSFIRCHHSFIINRDAIRELNFSENYIKLTNGATIPVSTTYKKNLMKILEYYALRSH